MLVLLLHLFFIARVRRTSKLPNDKRNELLRTTEHLDANYSDLTTLGNATGKPHEVSLSRAPRTNFHHHHRRRPPSSPSLLAPLSPIFLSLGVSPPRRLVSFRPSRPTSAPIHRPQHTKHTRERERLSNMAVPAAAPRSPGSGAAPRDSACRFF